MEFESCDEKSGGVTQWIEWHSCFDKSRSVWARTCYSFSVEECLCRGNHSPRETMLNLKMLRKILLVREYSNSAYEESYRPHCSMLCEYALVRARYLLNGECTSSKIWMEMCV
ncbi:unnamed protein product [Urochloa humidicola]